MQRFTVASGSTYVDPVHSKRSAPVAIAAAYAACVLIWGTTWLAIKVSLTGFPPLTGAGLRFIVASAFLYAAGVALKRSRRRVSPPRRLVFVLALMLFGINYALTYLAETHLASGLVAVLFGTMPFFIFAFAHTMLGERADGRTVVGAVLALGGVAAISLVGDVRGSFPYVMAVLGASASSAFANVYLKRYAHADPFTTLPPAMLLAGLALAAWGLGFESTDWHRATLPAPLAALAYLALCGSALAFYFNHWLLQRIDSGVMGLSALMIPIVAVIVGTMFGHEVFGVRDVVGALLVIGGMSLALRRPRSPVPATQEANAAA